jgi:3-dehydroquinate synthetase
MNVTSSAPTAWVPGITSHGAEITAVYENAYDFSPWDNHDIGKTLIFVDQCVEAYQATKEAAAIAARTDCQIYRVAAGESLKTLSQYESHIGDWQRFSPDHVIVIGSGTTINFGLYAVATLGECHPTAGRPLCSIVPTNTMAICDVALGGLGLLNDQDGHKNALRKERDPSWIFLFEEYLEGCDCEQRRDGIAEVIKHSLLQKPQDLIRLTDHYFDKGLSASLAYDDAKLGLQLKADLIAQAPSIPHSDIEFAMSYGHLHAHVIEEHWHGSIPHGQCVYIGLIIDLYLSRHYLLGDYLAERAKVSAWRSNFYNLLRSECVLSYLQSYPKNGQFYADDDHYYFLPVAASVPVATEPATRDITLRSLAGLTHISAAFDRFKNQLSTS